MPDPADILRTGFRLHTRLFLNALAGVGSEAAGVRIDERTNSPAFIALHLVDVRHLHGGVPRSLGDRAENPFAALMAGVGTIGELRAMPELDDIRAAWTSVSAILDARLGQAGAATLAAASPQSFPVDDATPAGGLTFLLLARGLAHRPARPPSQALRLSAMTYG